MYCEAMMEKGKKKKNWKGRRRKSGKRWRHRKDGGAETSREDNINSDRHIVNTECPRGTHRQTRSLLIRSFFLRSVFAVGAACALHPIQQQCMNAFLVPK